MHKILCINTCVIFMKEVQYKKIIFLGYKQSLNVCTYFKGNYRFKIFYKINDIKKLHLLEMKNYTYNMLTRNLKKRWNEDSKTSISH